MGGNQIYFNNQPDRKAAYAGILSDLLGQSRQKDQAKLQQEEALAAQMAEQFMRLPPDQQQANLPRLPENVRKKILNTSGFTPHTLTEQELFEKEKTQFNRRGLADPSLLGPGGQAGALYHGITGTNPGADVSQASVANDVYGQPDKWAAAMTPRQQIEDKITPSGQESWTNKNVTAPTTAAAISKTKAETGKLGAETGKVFADTGEVKARTGKIGAETANLRNPTTTRKPLSGEASKVLSIATTMNPEIQKLKAIFAKDYRGTLTGYLTGTNRGLVKLVNNVADKVGRLRSGGAISRPEERKFLGQIASWMDLPFGTDKEAQAALDGLLAESDSVSASIHGGTYVPKNPGAQSGGDGTTQYSATATGTDGRKVGSNDGDHWYDLTTGEEVKDATP